MGFSQRYVCFGTRLPWTVLFWFLSHSRKDLSDWIEFEPKWKLFHSGSETFFWRPRVTRNPRTLCSRLVLCSFLFQSHLHNLGRYKMLSSQLIELLFSAYQESPGKWVGPSRSSRLNRARSKCRPSANHLPKSPTSSFNTTLLPSSLKGTPVDVCRDAFRMSLSWFIMQPRFSYCCFKSVFYRSSSWSTGTQMQIY